MIYSNTSFREKKIVLFFLIISSINITTSVKGQTNFNTNNNYYNWFDNIIGVENTEINNGIVYKEKYKTIDGNHKFYSTSKFINGNITYHKQPFFNIEMKYDIYDDEIIIKLPNQSSFSIIQLIKDKVDTFSINNHKFINISKNQETFYNEEISGFYEIPFQSKKITLLKKHKKERKQRIGNFVYSQFKDNSSYYIFYNLKYYKINSKNKLLKLFPSLKKNIASYYSSKKQQLKVDPDLFMVNLTKHLNILLKNQETKH